MLRCIKKNQAFCRRGFHQTFRRFRWHQPLESHFVSRISYRLYSSDVIQQQTAKVLEDTLTPIQRSLLQREKRQLDQLDRTVGKIGAIASDKTVKVDQKLIQTTLRDLDEFFILSVMGEFNVGKSSFLNKILGTNVLKSGIVPTTSR